MRFTYRSGERPLSGFTLKRGVGQGGFGEVYFAVSESGKEVALKLLRGSSDVELRGVANCLNLKHPNLVHIYDLKQDDHGNRWLVMEYVLGESLAQVIDRHPGGLPQPLAVEWFQNLARAVGYLHEHGVVHRDLKPANIFIEHGNLKVGDYGLCKAMAASARGQTRQVGTVHYMAPEIAGGNYTKSIDIYACGVILHEMLTGKLVFDGESDGEILMKHLTATPDVAAVPAAFRAVVAKALDKNPTQRFASMVEFARAVEAAGTPAQAAAPVPPPLPTPGASDATVADPPLVIRKPQPLVEPRAVVPVAKPLSGPGLPVRGRLSDMTGALAKAPLVAAAGVLPWALVTGTYDQASVGKMFLLTLAASWAVIAAAGGAAFKASDTWGRRLRMAVLGLVVGGFACWLDGPPGLQFSPPPDDGTVAATPYLGGAVWQTEPGAARNLGKYALYFGCVLGAARWWRMAARDRKERFSLFPPFVAVFWGLVLSFLWPWGDAGTPANGVIPLALAAVAVQWVSPWAPPPPPPAKRLRWRAA